MNTGPQLSLAVAPFLAAATPMQACDTLVLPDLAAVRGTVKRFFYCTEG